MSGDKKLSQLPKISTSDNINDDDLMYLIHDLSDDVTSNAGNLLDIKTYINSKISEEGSSIGQVWEHTTIKDIKVGAGGVLVLTENGKVYGGRAKTLGFFAGMTTKKNTTSNNDCPTYGIGDYMLPIYLTTPSEEGDDWVPVVEEIMVANNMGLILTDDGYLYTAGKNKGFTEDKSNMYTNTMSGVTGLCGFENGLSVGQGQNNEKKMIYYCKTDDNIYGRGYFGSEYSSWTATNLPTDIINVVSLGAKSPSIAWSNTKVYTSTSGLTGFNPIITASGTNTIKTCAIAYRNGDNGVKYSLYAIEQGNNEVIIHVQGDNKYGQLGIGSTDSSENWQSHSLTGIYIDFKIEGSATPALLINVGNENKLYKCGYNKYNQILDGASNTDNVDSWTEVNSPSEPAAILSCGVMEKNESKSQVMICYIRGIDGLIYARGKNKINADTRVTAGTASDSEILDKYTRVQIDKNNASTIDTIYVIDTHGVGSKGDTSLAYSKGTGIAYVWGNNSTKKILFSTSNDKDDVEVPTPIHTFSDIQKAII